AVDRLHRAAIATVEKLIDRSERGSAAEGAGAAEAGWLATATARGRRVEACAPCRPGLVYRRRGPRLWRPLPPPQGLCHAGTTEAASRLEWGFLRLVSHCLHVERRRRGATLGASGRGSRTKAEEQDAAGGDDAASPDHYGGEVRLDQIPDRGHFTPPRPGG